MTGTREAELIQTVDLLLDARRTGSTLDGLPAALTPANMEEVYMVQDRLAADLGESSEPGGWKVGAPSAEATPMFCPMPRAWIAPNDSVLTGNRWRYRGLEAEIAFLVGGDLPPREPGRPPYNREEVLAAMASCHPAIEVLETAFTDPTKVPREAMLADLQMHGGFIFGPPVHNWRSINFNQEKVTLAVDAVIRVERTGSNTSGDLLKLLPWLAKRRRRPHRRPARRSMDHHRLLDRQHPRRQRLHCNRRIRSRWPRRPPLRLTASRLPPWLSFPQGIRVSPTPKLSSRPEP